MNKLKTPFDIGDIPHAYYPREQMKRESFLCLNAYWSLSVGIKGEVDYVGEILVPFPPESEASGIERITKKGETLIYQRVFELEPNGRTLIHFGAVDTVCRVFINSKPAGEHSGGYLPFTLDITELVCRGENTVTVTVEDPLSHDYAWGKQKHKRGGMWYTPVSGIWQSVWIESVPEHYIESLKLTPTLSSVTVETVGGENMKTLIFEGREYTYEGERFTLEVDSPHLWTPEDPYLYTFELVCGQDKISSYFALRTVTVEERRGVSYICLNCSPYFFHGLLDQGYYPEGIYTPASAEAYLFDILEMKRLGFNMLRKHIKIEPDIFYYYCDKYGMIVFQDMVNNGGYNFLLDTALPTVGIRRYLSRPASKKRQQIFMEDAVNTVKLLYNHPSVVYYTIFNEGWGQHKATKVYRALKPLDTTRVWDTASGWFKDCESDVQSEHIYFKPVRLKGVKGRPMVLSEFGGYSCKLPEHSFNLAKTYGYKTCETTEGFTEDICKLYRDEIIPMIEKGLCATVLTQVSDVEDETNGIVTYDRRRIKPIPEKMQTLSKELFTAFYKSVEK